MNPPLPALVIGGPTASGKTSIAIAVAKACNGEIIGADAFQLYRGLPILTAQPSAEERAQVPHHLIGEFDLTESLDVTRYLQVVREKIQRIREADRVPILVGGTGLYIRSVLFGLAQGLPSPDPALRLELEAQPLSNLQNQLAELDPLSHSQIDLQNPRRVIRALEVCIQTGHPFSSFKHDTVWQGPPIGIWLSRPRPELQERIDLRSEQMFRDGVLGEVRSALPAIGVTAAQAIGLRQIEDHLAGRLDRQQTVELIALATRQYAKRQETWFRKETALEPTPPEAAVEKALAIIRNSAA